MSRRGILTLAGFNRSQTHSTARWQLAIIECMADEIRDYSRTRADPIDYECALKPCSADPSNPPALLLPEKLWLLWRNAYIEMTGRQTDIVRIRHNSFEYIYDHYPELQPAGSPPCSDVTVEPRLVVAFGTSSPSRRGRDDGRLKGWVGPTEKLFGRSSDKGHFIAHSIGGAVDGLEANVYVQRRDLNRGWSMDGKRFRKMEAFCVNNPGTFCFCRPLYHDQSAKPSFIEFGVRLPEDKLWVERFDNRLVE
jgi:hypothetical protein